MEINNGHCRTDFLTRLYCSLGRSVLVWVREEWRVVEAIAWAKRSQRRQFAVVGMVVIKQKRLWW